MSKSILNIATLCSCLLIANPVKADSFFDVFFDISIDERSKAPQLQASGRIITFGDGVNKVDTEMLSMSLSSHRGEDGSKSYSATVGVRSWIPDSSGKVSRVDSFFDVFYRCTMIENEPGKCVITGTNAKTKGKHRGHVTVLK